MTAITVADQDEYAEAVDELAKAASVVRESAEQLLSGLKDADDGRKGISLIEAKNQALLGYQAETVRICAQLASGRSLQEVQAGIVRSAKYRTFLERVRPIESKARSYMDSLLQTTIKPTTSSSRGLKARVDEMQFSDDEDGSQKDGEDDEEMEGDESDKPKKYVPPKLVAVPYDEEPRTREQKQEDRAKRRALQSTLIQELRHEHSEAPDEIHDTGGHSAASARLRTARKERTNFEEDYMMRMRLTKKQMADERRQERDATLSSLLSFGDYMGARTRQAKPSDKEKGKKNFGKKKKSKKGGGGSGRTFKRKLIGQGKKKGAGRR